MNEFQSAVEAKGQAIFDKTENDGGSIFNKDWWYGRIMEWSMKNTHFKTQMFRFVDVLPYLKSGQEVARHLKEYFAEKGEDLPSVFNMGLGLGNIAGSLAPGLLAGAVRKNVTQMAKMFITGETPDDALPVLKKARKSGIGFTADLLGEACLSEKEALEYQRRYKELISWLADDAKKWDDHKLLDFDHVGPIPKVNVSVKASALYSQIKIAAWEDSKTHLKERIRPILDLAIEKNVFINLDMEQYELKDLTLEVFEELMLELKYVSYRHFGIVIQAYLRDSFADVQRMVEFARRRGTPFTIRLVKGAYWDFETLHAAQMNWSIPVFTNKKESDANYERCARLLLENYKLISLALGSHNVRSLAASLVVADELKVPRNAFEIQMLYGMADPFKKAFVKEGYRVREYATIGELIPGMAYLVRRLLENTSNESFLRSKFADGAENQKLLSDPAANLTPTSAAPPAAVNGFKNEPLVDFVQAANRKKMTEAIQQWRARGKQTVLPIIDQREVRTGRIMKVYNPSQTSELLAEVEMASVAEADRALASAEQAFAEWKKTSADDRAKLLEKMADIFVRRRFEIMACQVLEAGKSWKEADGDICEAVDFLRYYARDMRKLAAPKRVGNAPGELSLYRFDPRGVSLVIAPWNFPLAILTGMVAGSLVTGNTVLIKPAEQTPMTAKFLIDALIEAGAPKGVAQFLPGYGEEIGAHLANHPKVSLICFTGSKAVGLKLIEAASRVAPGQKQVKKCIAEMGGKNALIIDSDADLDEAVVAVLYSAFGFQGQKCSASSRIVVLDEIYDRFVERLEEATKSLKVGPSEDPSYFLGPVIDQEAFDRIQSVIAAAKNEGRKLESPQAPTGGYFVPPTIFVDVAPNARVAQEEIFGPVIAVIRAKDLDEALQIANSSEYALTGGMFSRSPANIEKAKREFDVGNLYINRGITGAMVERHPFGGHKLSGVGSKTGGPEYLKQFMSERVVIENMVRRGFAPSEEDIDVGGH